MPTAESSQSLEPVPRQRFQPHGLQLVELEETAVLAEAARKAVQKTEPDASGDSEEYRMEDEVAEVGSDREHMALRPVEADSVEAGC